MSLMNVNKRDQQAFACANSTLSDAGNFERIKEEFGFYPKTVNRLDPQKIYTLLKKITSNKILQEDFPTIEKELLVYFEKGKNDWALYYLSQLHLHSTWIRRNPKKGIEYLKEASSIDSNLGSQAASEYCQFLYNALIKAKSEDEKLNLVTELRTYARSLSESKYYSHEGFFYLGVSYLFMEGDNLEQAVSHLKRSKSCSAKRILGLLYLNGIKESSLPEAGTPQGYVFVNKRLQLIRNTELAIKYLSEAAEAGDPIAQAQMGVIYRDGLCGVVADEEQALMWLESAGERGNFAAKVILRDSLGQGIGAILRNKSDQYWELQKEFEKLGERKASMDLFIEGERYFHARRINEDLSQCTQLFQQELKVIIQILF